MKKEKEEVINSIFIDVEYLSEQDMYRAFNEKYEVECFGKTEEDAISNSRTFLRNYFEHDQSKLRQLLLK